MIDPMLTLAINIQANPGVYALLLGSGISSNAGIPTGWGIVQDLIRKLATQIMEDCEPEPDKWYKDKFGIDAVYDDILGRLGGTQTERQNLLRGYIEPTEEEFEDGEKVPTQAHKAIAELVKDGYIKVILTTNFDRLLENALEEIGITPTVISSDSVAKGAIPLVHLPCTIIKVNGDYLDTRIKNTSDELADIESEIDERLDRIFDEFGLIICGWSGDWDTALRKAIERAPNRRYTTYWTTLETPNETAQNLIDHRKAEVITIEGADSFFLDISEKVESLSELSTIHPLKPEVLLKTVKKYLAEEKYFIRLEDLVYSETNALIDKLGPDSFPINQHYSDEELVLRMKKYEELTMPLLKAFAAICYWGNENHNNILVNVLERISNTAYSEGGKTIWLDLRRYPALLFVYAGSIASLAKGRYDTLRHILLDATYTECSYPGPIVSYITQHKVIANEAVQRLPGYERRYTALSDYLFEYLLNPLSPHVGNKYEYYFDLSEYLRYLIASDINDYMGLYMSPSLGRFAWCRGSFLRGETKEFNLVETEEGLYATKQGKALLSVGFFGGSFDRLLDSFNVSNERVNSKRLYR